MGEEDVEEERKEEKEEVTWRVEEEEEEEEHSNALYKQVIYGQRQDHNTGNYVPYSLRWVCGSNVITSPSSHYSEDAGDGDYGLTSLSEKTRIVIAKAAYSPQLF